MIFTAFVGIWPLSVCSSRCFGRFKLCLVLFLTIVLNACGGDESDVLGRGNGETDDPDSTAMRMGSGTGADFVEGALSASSTTLQSGGSSTVSVSFVNGSGNPVADDVSVEFASACEGNGLASFDNASVKATAGRGSTVYTSEGCSGNDVVTATARVGNRTLTATVTLTIAADQVLAVEFVSVSAQQLSLAGIGGNETAQVVFRLVGSQSVPIVGESVSFVTSTTAGGISLAPGTESSVSDNDGLVSTVLQSGTVAGPASIIATHDATGVQGISEDIVISTGVPVSRRFSLSMSVFNPGSAYNTDGITVTVNIIASDQFGNDAPDGTRVSFVSPESGNIDSFCTLVSGECSVTWRSSSPRPVDMRLTILAYTDGAEDFTDNNGNNVFDSGDTFFLDQDLAEAFVDENENLFYDVGEFFVNVNAGEPGDGGRDTGDGVWNGPCMTGVNPIALCPGDDSVTISEMAVIVMPSDDARLQTVGDLGPEGTAHTLVAATTFSGLTVADDNIAADVLGGNPMPAGTTVVFTTTNGNLIGNASFTVPNNVIRATGPYSVTLEPDGVSDSGTLTLSVQPPGNADPTEFRWTIRD